MQTDLNREATGTARATRDPDEQDGIFGTFVHLTVGMIESTVRTSTRVSRSLLTETRGAVNATIGFAESTGQAIARGARSINDGGFGLADESVARMERAALAVLRQTQSAGDRASELAAATSHAVVGTRGFQPVAA